MTLARPHRIQLRRSKGWRMPPNTVRCARPATWGNPIKVGELDWRSGVFVKDNATAVELYRKRFFESNDKHWNATMRRFVRADLRGKNLACYCPLDQPCHADVLLEVANA